MNYGRGWINTVLWDIIKNIYSNTFNKRVNTLTWEGFDMG